MTRPWQSFPDAFLTAARAHARAPALHAADGSVRTYAEVRRAVEVLAGQLRRHFRRPETLVGLALPRSPEWVVGALAAWRAGAAFVPLDPGLPPHRLEFLLRDAAPAVVLTTDIHAGPFAAAGVPLLRLPLPATAATGVPELPAPGPNRLAYRIYTSGSGGRPKGVDVEHRGLVPLLLAQIEAFDLRPGDRVLWLLSPAFDASLSDVGTALLAGAALFAESEDDLRDPDRLVRLLHRRRITHLDVPPALLRVLDPAALPASLHTLVIGGEPCPTETVRAWARRFRLVNVYGPTEATICSSLCVCDAECWSEPLLGHPTPGVRYVLLGADGQPLAGVGVGELAIAGDGLARGYRGLPELTADRFIRRAGDRLFRTGDRVRRRADGEYVFLGRLDRQVKVRGQLVAPEEVEAVLLQHPGVRQAVVIQRRLGEGAAARDGLVAFLAPADQGPADAELRDFLSARLPAWMVPVRFVRADVLPRTPTGKPDPSALADWPLDGPPPPAGAEETPIARELGDLLRYFLGVPRIDWEAGFADHGGDSLTLLSVALAARARGLDLSPARLAAARRLADLVETGGKPGGWSADDLRRDADAVLAGLAMPETPAARRRGRPPACILLTGATGFLGSHLLAEFLRGTTARLLCLVRAACPEQGRGRLLASQPAERRQLLEAAGSRLEVVCGDLTAHRLGLDAPSWRRLAETADLVVHAAAGVHLLHDYAMLRPANVVGTGEVVRLCAAGGAVLHHVSSLAVFVGTDRPPGRFLESDDLTATGRVFGGYAQTKWAAEWLVRRSARRLTGCVVHRPGLVTVDSPGGAAAGNDLLSLFLRGLARLRSLPALDAERLRFDVTPVGYAAAVLAHLALHAEPAGLRTFHLAGPRTASLGELLAAVRAAGVAVETVAWPEWRRRLAELERTAPETAAVCLALTRAMPCADDLECQRTLDLFPATGVIFDQSATAQALRGSGIACPPPSPQLLGRCVAFALGPASPAESAP
jgi:amino acid adenylation domain-containing protein/thioester reductase-like protein